MTFFLLILGVLISTILAIITIATVHIRNKVAIELDVNDLIVRQYSKILSLTLYIRNTGNKPTFVSNPSLVIFKREDSKIEIPPDEILQEVPTTIETSTLDGNIEYIHSGQLLQKRLCFTLPENCEHKTTCYQLSIRYEKKQFASTSLLWINLNKGMTKKLTSLFVN